MTRKEYLDMQVAIQLLEDVVDFEDYDQNQQLEITKAIVTDELDIQKVLFISRPEWSSQQIRKVRLDFLHGLKMKDAIANYGALAN